MYRSNGVATLPPSRFSVTTPITLRKDSVILRGSGFPSNLDPNGSVEQTSGTMLHASGNGILVGNGSPRTHGDVIEEMGIWGPGVTIAGDPSSLTGYTRGIWSDVPAADMRLNRLMISNFDIGIHLNSQSDHHWISDSLVLYTGIPLRIDSTAYYTTVMNNAFWDNKFQVQSIPSFVDDDHEKMTRFVGNSFGRNSYLAGISNPADLFSARALSLISSNIFDGAGFDEIGGTGAHIADEIILGHRTGGVNYGNDQLVVGNILHGSNVSGGSLVHVVSDRNFIAANGVTNGDKFFIVDSTANDTVIEQPQLTSTKLTDNGVRTSINRTSKNAGDPNAAGNWNGVTKPIGEVIVDTTGTGATVKPAWLYHPSLTNGRQLLNPGAFSGTATLSSNFTITAAADTFEDTGLNVTLASGGVYEVGITATGFCSAAAFSSISCELYNSTDSVDASERVCVTFVGSGGASTGGTVSSAGNIIDATAGAKTIKLYTKRSGSAFSTTQLQVPSAGSDIGSTKIWWKRVG